MKIGILVAMGMEEGCLARHIEQQQPETRGGKKFLRGNIGQAEVVLHRCGWGMAHAARGVRALVDHHKPDLIVNYGVSGGMNPDIQLGDTVIASSSIPCLGRAYTANKAEATDQALAEFAAGVLLNAKTAPVCTSQALIVNIKRKARIAAKTGAVCCDMETYTAAKAANELGIPLLVIRSLSDTMQPKSMVHFFKNGKAAAIKVAKETEQVIKALAERSAS